MKLVITARGAGARRHRRLSLAAKTLTLAAIVKCRRVENILAKIRDIDTLGCGVIVVVWTLGSGARRREFSDVPENARGEHADEHADVE